MVDPTERACLGAAGFFEFWEDEQVTDYGRRRFHGLDLVNDKSQREARSLKPMALVVRWAFAARPDPWGMPVVDVSNESEAASLIAWSLETTVVLEGRPPTVTVLDEDTSRGDLGLRRMMQPEGLLRCFDLPHDGTVELEATVSRLAEVGPDLVTLAADIYRATLRRGVILAWEAYIESKLATRRLLSLAPQSLT